MAIHCCLFGSAFFLLQLTLQGGDTCALCELETWGEIRDQPRPETGEILQFSLFHVTSGPLLKQKTVFPAFWQGQRMFIAVQRPDQLNYPKECGSKTQNNNCDKKV